MASWGTSPRGRRGQSEARPECPRSERYRFDLAPVPDVVCLRSHTSDGSQTCKGGEEIRAGPEPPTPRFKGDLHALGWITRKGGNLICEVVVNAAPIGKPHQFLHGAVRLGCVDLSRQRWHGEIPLVIKAKRSNKSAILREGRCQSCALDPCLRCSGSVEAQEPGLFAGLG